MTEPLVLIVESHPVIQEVLADLVLLENMNALTANNATQALSLARESSPDLVVVNPDLTGDMNGLDLLYIIRKYPKLAHTPVLLLIPNSLTYELPVDDDHLLILKMRDLDHLSMALRCLLPLSRMNREFGEAIGAWN